MGAAPGGPSARAAAACGAGRGVFGRPGVGPKRASVGVPVLAARWVRPESLPTNRAQRAMQAAACWQGEAADEVDRRGDGGEHLRGGWRARRRRGRRR